MTMLTKNKEAEITIVTATAISREKATEKAATRPTEI